VRKALASGRIVAGPDGTIDPVAADEQWAASTDLSKPRNSVTGVPKKRRAPGAPSDPLGVDTPSLASGNGHGAGEAANGGTPGDAARLVASYAGSRAAREGFNARLAKLDFEERSGKLVDADQVRAKAYAAGRRLLDRLMTMADRLATQVAATSDRGKCHRLITQEVHRALDEIQVGGAKGLQ
jgi:hypothetical protein